jgi:hypothetical protein
MQRLLKRRYYHPFPTFLSISCLTFDQRILRDFHRESQKENSLFPRAPANSSNMQVKRFIDGGKADFPPDPDCC